MYSIQIYLAMFEFYQAIHATQQYNRFYPISISTIVHIFFGIHMIKVTPATNLQVKPKK